MDPVSSPSAGFPDASPQQAAIAVAAALGKIAPDGSDLLQLRDWCLLLLLLDVLPEPADSETQAGSALPDGLAWPTPGRYTTLLAALKKAEEVAEEATAKVTEANDETAVDSPAKAAAKAAYAAVGEALDALRAAHPTLLAKLTLPSTTPPPGVLRRALKALRRAKLPQADTPESVSWLGHLADELLERLVSAAARKGGEYVQPLEIGELLARLLRPAPGATIYDGTCGAGVFLLTQARAARAAGEPAPGLFGQEIDPATHRLAQLNLLLHGHAPTGLALADTLVAPAPRGTADVPAYFDVAVGNPPVRVPDWSPAAFFTADAARRAWGWDEKIEKTLTTETAFLLHLLTTAHPERGRVGVVMLHSTLNHPGEREIRAAWIEQNQLDAVVALPPNLLFGTHLPAALLVFRFDRAALGRGTDVLFLDATRHALPGKRRARLDPTAASKLVAAYEAYADQMGVAKRVGRAAIEAVSYNLLPARYLPATEAEAFSKQEPVPAVAELEAQYLTARQALTEQLRTLGISA